MIRLCAKPNDDLNWEEALEKAAALEGPIVWEFDLGLNEPYFPIEDELHFQSLAMALTHFTKEVWPRFPTSTGILYRGSADFSSFFKWSEKQEENWEAWKGDRLEASPSHLKRLFCAETFVTYFQMLAHRLPDELPLTLVLDPKNTGTLAETLHLLSPERFDHFLLETGMHFSSKLGVCFPGDEQCSGAVLNRLDALLPALDSFRPIYEPLMTEQWDGLDELYVLSEAVTPQGKRKLLGFCAAGGTVITEGEPLGVPNEIRGRGI